MGQVLNGQEKGSVAINVSGVYMEVDCKRTVADASKLTKDNL